MKKGDIELPPMPDIPGYRANLFDPEVTAVEVNTAEDLIKAYARAAIEPYKQRISELEAQLEAIGAGGVTQGQRLIEAALQSQPTEAFPCRIIEADFETGTVTLEMQGKYTVSAGQKYLCNAPLQSQDREDAERYRWLRLQRTITDHACVTWNIGHDWVQMDGAELDAAIDHARRAREGG